MSSVQGVVYTHPLCLFDNALFFYHVGVAGVDDLRKLTHSSVEEELIIVNKFTVAGEEYVGCKHLVGLNHVLLNEVHILAEVHEAGAAQITDIQRLFIAFFAFDDDDEDLAELVLGLQSFGLLDDFFTDFEWNVHVTDQFDCGRSLKLSYSFCIFLFFCHCVVYLVLMLKISLTFLASSIYNSKP